MKVQTSTLSPNQSPHDRHLTYCGLDCCLTLEIFEVLEKQLREKNEPYNALIYDFERAMQGPALELMERGWLIDEEQRREASKFLNARKVKLQELLNDFARILWDKPLNANSPAQLKAFFYGTMELPEQHSIVQGNRKVSTNREALEKLSTYFYARPLINVILAIRETVKKLSVLETEISSDGRMRTSYNVAGTETGRWCLDSKTEVLTARGWTLFENWNAENSIITYNRGTLQWEKCEKLQFPFNGTLLEVNTKRISFAATKEHRLLYMDSHGDWRSAQVGDKKFLSRVPLAGNFAGTSSESVITRIAVMMQADGHILNAKKIRWHFTKERKINRCKLLLTKAGLEFREAKSSDGSTYIYTNNLEWLSKSKTLGSWVLYHNPDILIDEVQYWDGDRDRNGATNYYTSDATNAEWMKTIAHLAGRFASVRVKRQSNSFWNTAYRVVIGRDWSTRVQKEDYKEIPYNGTVYCAKTNSGAFLIRRNGQISITENSSSSSADGTGTNLQNITPELRRMFVSDSGYKLCYLDLEQAESRVVGLLVYRVTGDLRYLEACDSGDLHTTVCKLVWPNLPWTGDLKKDKEVAEQPFYRHFSYRDMSKRGSHGSNYYGTPRTMARHLKIEEKVMVAFQDAYFKAFPIRSWHDWVRMELIKNQALTTLLGRKRTFLGRSGDDSTLREAIAYEPQSTVGDLLNLALWRIWKFEPRVQILGQIHDAVVFQYPDNPAQEADILSSCRELARIPLTSNDKTIIIPAELQIGWNWAKKETHPNKKDWTFEDGNPFGLAKWRGVDERRLGRLD